MVKANRRKAVLVGCNYPNTKNELHGCINDVLSMRDVLVNRFGFDHGSIQLLTDKPGSEIMPTGANIKKALEEMINQAETGDVLFFHYSGHGTRIPSHKSGHPFRQDEAIVPCDFNLITDIDFRQLVNSLPKGAGFTIISDSCHSGGLIDKEKEQIGPSSTLSTTNNPSFSITPKTIPIETLLQHLSSLTNINTTDIGTHLLQLFGTDSSLKFRLPSHELDSLHESMKNNTDQGILLSGCQANETSADMNPSSGNGGKAYGAFSNSVQMVLKQNSGDLTNKRIVILARKLLQDQGFHQHPCLYCSDDNADRTFLCQNSNY